jgi:MFS transporter, NNP family, nitrate/nitrite transporter
MKQSFQGSPQEGLFGATLGFFVGFAAVALYGPTAAMFRDAMGLDPGAVGWLVAMPALSGSILRIPFSAWVDTTGGRKPFLVLLVLSIVGMAGLLAVVLTLYPDGLHAGLFPLLTLLGILCGCGIATFSVGISQVSYWFPASRQGSALGIFAGVGNLAPGVFSFLLPAVLGAWGLGGAYMTWLVFLCLGTLLYYLKGRNAWYFQLVDAGHGPREARELAGREGQEFFPAGGLMDSLKLSARIWKTWCLVGIYFSTFGGFIALTAWLPTYWSAYFGVGALGAGLLTALYSILASVVRVFGGSISDRFGGERTALAALGLMLVGALGLSLTASFHVGCDLRDSAGSRHGSHQCGCLQAGSSGGSPGGRRGCGLGRRTGGLWGFCHPACDGLRSGPVRTVRLCLRLCDLCISFGSFNGAGVGVEDGTSGRI